MSKDSISLILMTAGVFLLFHNIGSMSAIALQDNQVLTAEVK
jgi:hypothetical protein